MIKKSIYLFLFSCFIVGCGSKKIKLESNSLVNIKSANFLKYASGIKGGGSGYNIRIELNEIDINNKLVGVYFRQKYALLKYNESNIFTAYISKTERKETNLDVLDKPENNNSTTKKIQEMKLPFSIKDNEAVVECLVKNKKKYFKIIIEEKLGAIPQ